MKIGIERAMIVVVSGVWPQALPRTTKMNLIRPQLYMKYKEAIDAAYDGRTNGHANGHAK